MVANNRPQQPGADGRVRLEAMALSALRPAPYNPRQIDEKALQGLGASIGRFGLVEPIIWNRRTGHVVGGHQRLRVLQEQGAQTTDVVAVDFSLEEEKALNLALNSPAIAGTWTPAVFALLREVKAALPELAEALRMPALELALPRGLRPVQEVVDPPTPEPPEQPVTKPGDLWRLGAHRILCGDSTKPEDLARLMQGQTAALLATDPPYLVDYTGGNHPQSFHNRPEVRDKHWDEYSDPATGVAFFEGYLRAALAHCAPDVAIYQWFATKRHVLVEEAWGRVGLLVHQELVWVKTRPVLTRSHFMWQHEPCLYGWREGTPPRLRPPPAETTVWPISQAGEQDGIHPTQKPIEIFARPVRWHTEEGALCLEPFSGSGTQIAACEQLGRRCCALEISPAFVDVAVLRWEQLTGRKGELERAG